MEHNDVSEKEKDTAASRTRCEVEALLEEYKTLRADMLSHADGLMNTALYSLIILFAAVPAIFPLVERGLTVALLAMPLALPGLNWLLQWRIVSILVTGQYIRKVLTPKMDAALNRLDRRWETPDNRTIWEWESYNALTHETTRPKRTILRVFGVFNTLVNFLLWLPNVLSLTAFFVLKHNTPWAGYEVALFALGATVSLLALVTAVLTPLAPKAYREGVETAQ
jgi:hypothetical protein